MTKEFGIAQLYQAARLTNAAVIIVATGEAPNFNTRVTIEQLPWRIYPPHFGLFFDGADDLRPRLRPGNLCRLRSLDRAELRQGLSRRPPNS